jgi:hypothetical protein
MEGARATAATSMKNSDKILYCATEKSLSSWVACKFVVLKTLVSYFEVVVSFSLFTHVSYRTHRTNYSYDQLHFPIQCSSNAINDVFEAF